MPAACRQKPSLRQDRGDEGIFLCSNETIHVTLGDRESTRVTLGKNGAISASDQEGRRSFHDI
jgi:hypothetical protein